MTEPPAPLSLTDRAIQRLRKLASGNGLAPAAIQLIASEEKTYALTGIIGLEPVSETESKIYTGGPRGRDRKILPNAGALKAEIARRQQEFAQQTDWIIAATAQLKQQPGEGWGLDDTRVPLPEFSAIFAASAPCPSCQGNRLLNCPQCNGQGTVICTQCQGHKQELCYNCGGRGVNPVNHEQPCVVCNGQRYVPCRFCRAAGFLPCPTCHGKRGVACTGCNGTGLITEEVTLSCAARTHFRVAGEDLPAGLRRGLDRVGLSRLPNGHADIASVKPPAEETDTTSNPEHLEARDKKPPPPQLHYNASLPYADLTVSFGGKRALISAFGKKGLLMGVPAFLDTALEQKRKALAQAAQGRAGLDEALEARLIRESLTLQINGKGQPEELRKLYPLGLSPAAAQEILKNIRLALNSFTRRLRAVVATASALASLGAMAGLFLTPAYAHATAEYPPMALLALSLSLPILLGVLSWLALASSTKLALQRRFPTFKIPLWQQTGRTGYIMLGAILIFYTAILWAAPVKPWWVMILLHMMGRI